MAPHALIHANLRGALAFGVPTSFGNAIRDGTSRREDSMLSRSVRATRSEQRCTLPGDSLIPEPVGSLTHAITIACPPREVWPWLAQMGAGSRGGWYSYDRIDNAGRPSADRIRRELQNIAIGTVLPALPGSIEG